MPEGHPPDLFALQQLDLTSAISWHFERDPIPYALETDWPVEDPVKIGPVSAGGKFPLR